MQNVYRVTCLLGVVVVVSMLVNACTPPLTSPATAVPAAATVALSTAAPTIVPPTLAPTAVPPTPAPTIVPPTLTPTAVPPTLAPTTDALALLKTFQDSFNKGDTDSLLALFVTDPNFTLVSGLFGAGEYSLSATTVQALRDLLEIGFKLNTQLTVSDCQTSNNQAACTLVIKDDCNSPSANPYHIRVQFALKDGKISSVYGRWDVSEESAFNPYNSARQDWARQNLPTEAAIYGAYNSPDANDTVPVVGLAPGETASEYGQAVDRICKGYAAAGH